MRNLFTQALPREVKVLGQACPIETDYRPWVRLTDILLDKNASPAEKAEACMGMYQHPPKEKPEALSALLEFYRGWRGAEGKAAGGEQKTIFSYAYDGGLLLAAFRLAYQMDLLGMGYLHWWEFLWLFEGLPESCELKRRMAFRSIRLGEISDKKERQWLRRIQQAVALPSDTVEDVSIGTALWGGEAHG